jgi:hypothetical protein
MYMFPMSFMEFSNREDFFQLLAVNDDDTGDPINLTGIQMLANPNGFTGSNWTVTDGTIVTSSVTPFTVPGYPINDQLTAVALAVGLGLSILPGDAVTIADAGGAATMIGYVTSYTPANGALVAQCGLMFQFEIRAEHPRHQLNTDYSSWYDFGFGPGNAPLISAALGTGLTIVDVGMLQINIPEITLRQLHHRSYMAGLTATDGISTRQLLIARLPIQYGGVTQ